MQAFELNNLIELGATDRVRTHLKKLSLKDRLPILHQLIPYVQATPKHLNFFHQHFANEIGALIQSSMNYKTAEILYNQAKLLRSKRR